ncbi:hypothetical protein CJ179_35240 [Rhodococcus sp. ACS1]|uniref:HtaA domain-containing protein n=1 Tax=Rhodococcus sp. ACS1 TaxID=2028570 RepID=UPI000BB162C5|nr:HtaA domain-containing protein [Rhodococcus sp. ACS1]PBC39306.1 hypothetical protein CJ179_35240 [Rhodococcus sp. ACS1]
MTAEPTQLLGLLWGVKHSFRVYVARSPGSRIAVGHGAGVSASDEFFFAPAAEQGNAVPFAQGKGTLRFTGSVYFVAHQGFLSVPIVDPWVEFDGADAVLSIAGTGSHDARVRIARLRPGPAVWDAGAWYWPELPARLHEDGVEVFGGNYPVGAPLDPVRIRVSGSAQVLAVDENRQ